MTGIRAPSSSSIPALAGCRCLGRRGRCCPMRRSSMPPTAPAFPTAPERGRAGRAGAGTAGRLVERYRPRLASSPATPPRPSRSIMPAPRSTCRSSAPCPRSSPRPNCREARVDRRARHRSDRPPALCRRSRRASSHPTARSSATARPSWSRWPRPSSPARRSTGRHRRRGAPAGRVRGPRHHRPRLHAFSAAGRGTRRGFARRPLRRRRRRHRAPDRLADPRPALAGRGAAGNRRVHRPGACRGARWRSGQVRPGAGAKRSSARAARELFTGRRDFWSGALESLFAKAASTAANSLGGSRANGERSGRRS